MTNAFFAGACLLVMMLSAGSLVGSLHDSAMAAACSLTQDCGAFADGP